MLLGCDVWVLVFRKAWGGHAWGPHCLERGGSWAIEASRCGSLCGNENIWHEALWHCWDGVRMSLLQVFTLELVSGRSL